MPKFGVIKILDSEFSESVNLPEQHYNLAGYRYVPSLIKIYSKRKKNVAKNLLVYYASRYASNNIKGLSSSRLDAIRLMANQLMPEINYDQYHYCVLRQYEKYKWIGRITRDRLIEKSSKRNIK